MQKIIISDSKCLPILYEIGALEILQKQHGKVYTTNEIINKFKGELPNWIIVETVTNEMRQRVLETKLAKEESSALALALENNNCILILEKTNTIIEAQKFNIKFIGILEIIISAKLNGIITSIKPILEKLKKTNYSISKELELYILKEANEH
jgi:predicted nucleic acid-binding protein